MEDNMHNIHDLHKLEYMEVIENNRIKSRLTPIGLKRVETFQQIINREKTLFPEINQFTMENAQFINMANKIGKVYGSLSTQVTIKFTLDEIQAFNDFFFKYLIKCYGPYIIKNNCLTCVFKQNMFQIEIQNNFDLFKDTCLADLSLNRQDIYYFFQKFFTWKLNNILNYFPEFASIRNSQEFKDLSPLACSDNQEFIHKITNILITEQVDIRQNLNFFRYFIKAINVQHLRTVRNIIAKGMLTEDFQLKNKILSQSVSCLYLLKKFDVINHLVLKIKLIEIFLSEEFNLKARILNDDLEYLGTLINILKLNNNNLLTKAVADIILSEDFDLKDKIVNNNLYSLQKIMFIFNINYHIDFRNIISDIIITSPEIDLKYAIVHNNLNYINKLINFFNLDDNTNIPEAIWNIILSEDFNLKAKIMNRDLTYFKDLVMVFDLIMPEKAREQVVNILLLPEFNLEEKLNGNTKSIENLISDLNLNYRITTRNNKYLLIDNLIFNLPTTKLNRTYEDIFPMEELFDFDKIEDNLNLKQQIENFKKENLSNKLENKNKLKNIFENFKCKNIQK